MYDIMTLSENSPKIIFFPFRLWQLIWYVIICFVGTVGNALVIYLAFSTNKKGGINRKAPFNIYLIALAVTDLLICLTCIPIYLLSTSMFNHPGGLVGDVLCKTVTGYFLPFWMLDFSAFLLIAIAMERRRAILKPFTNLREPNVARTFFIASGLVALSVLTQSFEIYGGKYTSTGAVIGNWCAYDTDIPMKFLHYLAYVLKCIIPSILFFVCFYQIHNQLSKKATSLDTLPRICDDSRLYHGELKKSMSRTKQTIHTMQLVAIAFIVCVAINETLFMFLKPVLGTTNILWTSEIYQVTVMLRFTNSSINPILYALKSQIFRKRFKEAFHTEKSSHEQLGTYRRILPHPHHHSLRVKGENKTIPTSFHAVRNTPRLSPPLNIVV